VNYNGANFQANSSLGLMLVHMHNANAAQAEVISFGKPLISSFSPSTGPVGTQVSISGSNFGPGTSVTFFNSTAPNGVAPYFTGCAKASGVRFE